MKEFFRGLGKKVQSLLNRIFGKKQEEKKPTMISGYVQLVPGEVYIDGKPFGQVKSITTISKDEVSNEHWDDIMSLFGDGKMNCMQASFSAQSENQKNFFNIPLTFLPKRYWCKMLILSLAANQPYDYQAVDMSQYEEHKLAHFIVGRTCGIKELMEEYLEEVKNNFSSPEEAEEERQWLEEMFVQAKESGMHSIPIGPATLLYYEELGVWDFEDEDQEEE